MPQVGCVWRGSAVISRCGKYRYLLTRHPGQQSKTATFIMLNPSTADANRDDPTIRKCIGFTRRLGCGTLHVVNLFAFRATKPQDMKKASDPVGPRNRDYILRAVTQANGPVVCAWGIHGSYRDQDLTVLRWLADMGVRPLALALTKEGHPQHPLLVPYAAAATPFVGRKVS
jgi:hypothetical protein